MINKGALRWPVLMVAAIVSAILLPALVRGARRNWEYLQILHHAGPARDMPAAGDPAAGGLLGLRRALSRGDWPATERLLLETSGPDRLAALLVLHEADRRLSRHDVSGARAALEIVKAQTGDDVVMWYLLGDAYERAGLLEDAVRAFERGASRDPASPWSEGRYRTAMIYERQRAWQPLADLLGPLVASASDADFERQTQQRAKGGAVWQGTVLMLGQAYEHLGRPADAETAYERVCRLPAPRRDWTLNKTLVALARLKRGHGDLASAQQYLARALDLATEFPDAYRRPYEADTAAEADRLADQARREQRLDELQRPAEALVHRSPQSAGAWYELGLAREAACDLEAARSAYTRAAGLVRPGSGSFLEGRPSGAVAHGCVALTAKPR